MILLWCLCTVSAESKSALCVRHAARGTLCAAGQAFQQQHKGRVGSIHVGSEMEPGTEQRAGGCCVLGGSACLELWSRLSLSALPGWISFTALPACWASRLILLFIIYSGSGLLKISCFVLWFHVLLVSSELHPVSRRLTYQYDFHVIRCWRVPPPPVQSRAGTESLNRALVLWFPARKNGCGPNRQQPGHIMANSLLGNSPEQIAFNLDMCKNSTINVPAKFLPPFFFKCHVKICLFWRYVGKENKGKKPTTCSPLQGR